METLKVDWTGIKPGDYVIQCNTTSWDTGPRKDSGYLIDRIEACGDERHYLYSKDYLPSLGGRWLGGNTYTYKIRRPTSTTTTTTTTTTSKKESTSLWNGSCRLCGKGTYTGAWKVEHEGPCVK